jgi:hypothetical protein
MKKFFLAAIAVGALSTVAFASNDSSLPYDYGTGFVKPMQQIQSPRVMKKKIYKSTSTSSVGSVSSTGSVSDVERILEKSGDNHDFSQ